MSPRDDPFGPPEAGPLLRAPTGLAAALLAGGADEFAVISWPTAGAPPRLPLSVAEQEVVRLLGEGRSNAEIARVRGTSTRTVANQLTSIFRKSGVHSRFELLAFVKVP